MLYGNNTQANIYTCKLYNVTLPSLSSITTSAVVISPGTIKYGRERGWIETLKDSLFSNLSLGFILTLNVAEVLPPGNRVGMVQVSLSQFPPSTS